jgi:hypothetical protein
MSAQESHDGACTTPETSDNGGNGRAKKVLVAVNNLTHAVRRKSSPIPTWQVAPNKEGNGKKSIVYWISENQAPLRDAPGCPRWNED